MPLSTRLVFAAALLAAVAGCAGGPGLTPAASLPTPQTNPDTAITVGREQGGKFISFVGPKTQHDPPFLGVANTNFDCLRSWLDTRTGEVAHQLYVEDSYPGTERNWYAAQQEDGKALRFIPISKNEITCDNGCSYAEEFAAALPESLMRGSKNGLPVTFTAKSGARMTIIVPAAQLSAQIAAVESAKSGLSVRAAPAK